MGLSTSVNPYEAPRGRGLLVTLVSLVAASAVVVATTGAPAAQGNMYSNLYYVPIVVAALQFGPLGGLGVAVLVALLVSPWALDRGSSVWAWTVHSAVYMMVGSLAGLYSLYLHGRTREARSLSDQAVRAFVRAIDAKHPYTANHSERVASYAELAARHMGLSEHDTQRIALAARLHDVGKIGVRHTVLEKPGALSRAEMADVRQHPVESAWIVGDIEGFRDLLPAIRGHHEAWDGSGYPDQLAGESIHLWARVLAVADAWDAMTSDRAYRRALGHGEALRRLRAGSGSRFDPRVVQVFVAALEQVGEDQQEGVNGMPSMAQLPSRTS